MGCGLKLARILLFLFTLTFLLIGLALLGFGIWMLVSQDKLFHVLNMVNQKAGNDEVGGELERISQQKGVVATAGAILVAAGGISALISVFGCIGAIKQSKCLLGIYAGIIGGLLAVQIAAAVLAVIYKNTAVRLATEQLLILQNKYLISVNEFPVAKRQPHSAVSLAFNYMFASLKCCGVNSTEDAAQSDSWLKSNRTWLNRGNMSVPAACCPIQSDEARTKVLYESRWDMLPEYMKSSNCPIDRNGIHGIACVDALMRFITSYSTWILIGCGCFAGAQLLVIIFTTCMICAIKDSSSKGGKRYGKR